MMFLTPLLHGKVFLGAEIFPWLSSSLIGSSSTPLKPSGRSEQGNGIVKEPDAHEYDMNMGDTLMYCFSNAWYMKLPRKPPGARNCRDGSTSGSPGARICRSGNASGPPGARKCCSASTSGPHGARKKQLFVLGSPGSARAAGGWRPGRSAAPP